MSRLTLTLGIALLVVELVVASAVLLTSDDVARPWLTIVLGAGAGAAFVVSGFVALKRRPENRVGTYLLATGYLWFLAALGYANVAWLSTAGHVLSGLVWVPFTALVLAYPTGRLEGRFERLLPIVAGIALTVPALVASLAEDETTEAAGGSADSSLVVADNPSAGETFDRTTALVGLLLIALVVGALIRRWRHATPALRWQLWPVAGAGIAALLSIAIVVAADQISTDAADILRFLFFVAFAAVPVAFLLGLLRIRLARSSATDVLVAIQNGKPLREALAGALGDPGIEIAYPLESARNVGGNVWIDSRGHSVSEPVPDASRAVREVSRGGARIAALRYDAALDAEPEFLDAVAAAAGIALQNERLQAELRAEIEFMGTVTNTAPSLLVTIGTDGRVRMINRAALEAAGHPDEETVRGRYYWDLFIDSGEREAVIERFRALAPDFPLGEYENTFTNARGEARTIYWRTAPVMDAAGTVVSIVSGGTDITMRRRRELELERERDVQMTVFQTMPSIMVVLARDGTILDRDADDPRVGANSAFLRTVRWADDELVGRPFLELVVDDDGSAAKAIETAAAGEMSDEIESVLRSADGTSRTFAWTAIPIADVTGRRDRIVLISGADITERKRIAEDLRASRARLVRAEEGARRTLERNLHDGAQQRLVALSISLRLLESRLRDDPAAALDLLSGAQTELTHALGELRELARGIHPAVLTDRGLRAALETLSARAPVPVELTTPEERLHPDVEAAAYYVVAEALTNVAKYAGASSVMVSAAPQNGSLVVTVADDGIGGADPATGSGLRGLADRVAAFDGTLTVESPRGGGTSIRAEIPLTPQAET